MEHEAGQQAFEDGLDSLELGLEDDLVEQNKIGFFMITFLLELLKNNRQILYHLIFGDILIELHILYHDLDDLIFQIELDSLLIDDDDIENSELESFLAVDVLFFLYDFAKDMEGVDQVDGLLLLFRLELLDLLLDSCEYCVDQIEAESLGDFGHLGLEYFSDYVPDLPRLSLVAVDNQFDELVEKLFGEILIDNVGDEIESHVSCGGMGLVLECVIYPETAVKGVLKYLSIIVGQKQENLGHFQRFNLHHSLIA